MLENIVSFTALNRDTGTQLQKERWRELPTHVYVKILILGVLFGFLFRWLRGMFFREFDSHLE